jgi:hypothetical protein
MGHLEDDPGSSLDLLRAAEGDGRQTGVEGEERLLSTAAQEHHNTGGGEAQDRPEPPLGAGGECLGHADLRGGLAVDDLRQGDSERL